VVLGGSVGDGACPGGVGSDHASQAAVVFARRIGSEKGPVALHIAVELAHDHARLHPDPGSVRSDFEDTVHVAGEVHLDTRPHGAARQTRAVAPRDQGKASFSRIRRETGDILGVSRGHDSQGLDLVEAGVGGVEYARDGVELDVSGEQAAKIALHSGGALSSYADQSSVLTLRYCLAPFRRSRVPGISVSAWISLPRLACEPVVLEETLLPEQ
jgi:hypothetical protein